MQTQHIRSFSQLSSTSTATLAMKGAVLFLALVGLAKATPMSRLLGGAQCDPISTIGSSDQAPSMAKFAQLMDVTNDQTFFLYNDVGVDPTKSKFYVGDSTGHVYENNPDKIGNYDVSITKVGNTGGTATFNVSGTLYLLGALSALGPLGQLVPANLVPVQLTASLAFVFQGATLTVKMPSCEAADVPVNIADVCLDVWKVHLCSVIAVNVAKQL